MASQVKLYMFPGSNSVLTARLMLDHKGIHAWIVQGLLGGAQPNAADFQIAVNLSALLMSEDLAPLIEGRPAAALARRIAGDYGGHLGLILPAEWLPDRRSRDNSGSADDTEPLVGP